MNNLTVDSCDHNLRTCSYFAFVFIFEFVDSKTGNGFFFVSITEEQIRFYCLMSHCRRGFRSQSALMSAGHNNLRALFLENTRITKVIDFLIGTLPLGNMRRIGSPWLHLFKPHTILSWIGPFTASGYFQFETIWLHHF